MNTDTPERPVKLYTPGLLALCADLANYPLTDDFSQQSSGRSRTCGSTIEMGCDLDRDGRIVRVGMQVSACAVGQSSAAIMAKGAHGRSADEFGGALADIEQWLSSNGPLPRWPEFEALEQARAHSGRHDALLMPWRAMSAALSSRPKAR